LFLVGAFIVWVILERDLLLYFGVKLRIQRPGSTSVIKTRVWDGISKLSVKTVFWTLQATVFVLAQAATTTLTKRSCGNIDLIANSLGKVIIAFFFLLFLVLFFFFFTGAPNWDKYKGKSAKLTVLMLIVDGLARFSELSSGVWTDATVRAYNIIGRSERYLADEGFGVNIPLFGRIGTTIENNQAMLDSMHEQIMHLIAVSRTVVWVPFPLCVIIAKLSETLNQANVLIFVKTEPITLRRPFWLRMFIWTFYTIQMPLVMATVTTASSFFAGLLCGTLVPVFFCDVVHDFVHLFTKVKDYINSGQGVVDIEME
jgi:hypothetical protein